MMGWFSDSGDSSGTDQSWRDATGWSSDWVKENPTFEGDPLDIPDSQWPSE